MVRNIIIGAICLIVAAGLIFGGKYLYDTMRYKRIISEIEIRTPDISLIQDGVYYGSFDAILVAADVTVTVQDHRITEIAINEHKNERGKKAEVITEEVLTEQTLAVDTVSGATNSSKVILKAIEIALGTTMSEAE